MDYSLFTTIMNSVNIGEGLLATILVGISVVIITRDTRAMKIILLPIAIGWARTGINVPPWVLFASGVISIVTVVGTQNLGRTLTTIAQAPQTMVAATRWGRRHTYARELKKLGIEAIKQEGKDKYKDIMTYDQRIDREYRGAQFRDKLDALTTPLQIQKAKRSYITGQLSGEKNKKWLKERKKHFLTQAYNKETTRKLQKIAQGEKPSNWNEIMNKIYMRDKRINPALTQDYNILAQLKKKRK